MTGEGLLTLAKELGYSDVSALYAGVGENNLSAQTIVNRLLAAMGSPEATEEDVADVVLPIRPLRRSSGDPGVLVSGAADIWVKLARCCTPMPGDEIAGLVTRGRGVSVHRADCVNVGDASVPSADRFVNVEWAPSSGSVFLVVIQVEAMDRAKLLSDVTRVLSDHHVNILSASVTTNREQVAISRFTFEMGDAKHLGQVLAAVRRIEGVYDCFRVTSGVQG
jgi:GTP pyrophosphokinase